MRQNRFKSVAGLVGSLGTKQNDKSGIDTVLKDFPQSELQEERSFTERLTDGIGRMLDFLEEHLPERLRPLLEKARELLPDPEIGQQQEQQQHQRGMGGMEL